jgi:branched-chain amino acid transport system ATP-binding protein
MLLSLDNINSGYGGIPIVRNVDLGVAEGEVVALVGRNGVGKTTLIHTVIGLVPLSAGHISFNGSDISTMDASQRARQGIGLVPQGRGIFTRLTVVENLMMGETIGDLSTHRDYERVFEWFPILKQRRGQKAGTLSGGEQQMVAIGRILIGNPKLLLLDEPSEGIQPSIVEQIAEIICDLNEVQELTVLLVEQNLDLVHMTADRCMVMDNGTITDTLTPESLADPETAKRYLAI